MSFFCHHRRKLSAFYCKFQNFFKFPKKLEKNIKLGKKRFYTYLFELFSSFGVNLTSIIVFPEPENTSLLTWTSKPCRLEYIRMRSPFWRNTKRFYYYWKSSLLKPTFLQKYKHQSSDLRLSRNFSIFSNFHGQRFVDFHLCVRILIVQKLQKVHFISTFKLLLLAYTNVTLSTKFSIESLNS